MGLTSRKKIREVTLYTKQYFLNKNSTIFLKLSAADKCQRKACKGQRKDPVAVTGNNIFQVA